MYNRQYKVKMNTITPYFSFVEQPHVAVLPFAATWIGILTVFGVFMWWATDAAYREADMEQNVTYVKTTIEDLRTIVEENVRDVKASLDVLKEVTAENPRMEAMAKALELFLTERIGRCKTELKSDELGLESQRAQIELAMASHTPERLAELGLQKYLDDIVASHKQRRSIQLERLDQFIALRDEIINTDA
jgi:hypothetical protein